MHSTVLQCYNTNLTSAAAEMDHVNWSFPLWINLMLFLKSGRKYRCQQRLPPERIWAVRQTCCSAGSPALQRAGLFQQFQSERPQSGWEDTERLRGTERLCVSLLQSSAFHTSASLLLLLSSTVKWIFFPSVVVCSCRNTWKTRTCLTSSTFMNTSSLHSRWVHSSEESQLDVRVAGRELDNNQSSKKFKYL